jgi:hypothetical protein
MIDLVTGHVLLPHQADLNTKVRWERIWKTTIGEGITGGEERVSPRPGFRRKLQYLIVPFDHIESAKLSARILAAKKSGLAAIPYFGRGSMLAAELSAATATIVPTVWNWAIGDSIFFQSTDVKDFDSWDVRTITNVVGEVLTLNTAVTNGPYLAGTYCWPLLFGKLETGDINPVSNYRQGLEITVTEQ